MRLNKMVLALLAIFCIIVSAGAACASDFGGYAGSNYKATAEDDFHYSPHGLEPGAGLPLENQTADGPMNVTGNATHHVTANATGNVTGNATGNATGNNTHNATGNATHSQANANHTPTLLSTGNPILVLLAIFVVICGYGLIKRFK